MGAAIIALVVPVAAAGPVSAASSQGSLEICKESSNGAAGVSFSFAATNLGSGAAQTVTVFGGTCSIPVPVDAGRYTIQEDVTSALWNVTGVAVQPSSAFVKEDDLAGWVKVTVTPGTATQVMFTDAPSTATLRVCSWSSSEPIHGGEYSFAVGGTTLTARAGSSRASAGCSRPLSVQPGSRIKITENVPAKEAVAGVQVSDNAQLNNLNDGVARVTVGAGPNLVYFDNEPVGPPQTGFVEVCKDTDDAFTSGTFVFTLTDRTGDVYTESVPVGQCSGPVQVTAGTVAVAEAPTASTEVSDVSTAPESALGPHNLDKGTATIAVPVSSTSAGETKVHFVNSTLTGSLRVCKVLTESSGALAGAKFSVTIVSLAGTSTVQLVGSASPTGTCKNITGGVPIGSSVTVTEAAVPSVGANGGAPGAGASQTITVAAGTNTITFTSQAYGSVEVCKAMVDSDYDNTAFQFTVDGGAAVDVAAGSCSGLIVVPAGTAVVSEASTPGFAFVSSRATGSTSDNRVVSGTNPVTVSVPFADGASDETLVTFTNHVLRSQFKICKLIDADSKAVLGGQSFDFTWAASTGMSGGANVTPPYDAPGGSCTDLLGGPDGIPVVAPDGTPTTITVVETGLGGTYAVTGIEVDNGAATTNTPDTGTVAVEPNDGIVTVTYTNAQQPAL